MGNISSWKPMTFNCTPLIRYLGMVVTFLADGAKSTLLISANKFISHNEFIYLWQPTLGNDGKTFVAELNQLLRLNWYYWISLIFKHIHSHAEYGTRCPGRYRLRPLPLLVLLVYAHVKKNISTWRRKYRHSDGQPRGFQHVDRTSTATLVARVNTR